MPGRTVLQWDKDDCADAGLVKFDLLGLGMLSALQNAFTLVREHEGITLDRVSFARMYSGIYSVKTGRTRARDDVMSKKRSRR